MRLHIIFVLVFLSGCMTTYPNQQVVGQNLPDISGTSLEEQSIKMPEAFNQALTLLLIGYKQDSQFDIDRWLIALDMTQVNVPVYELPTIQGMVPRMFSTYIDNGMRAGIPKPLWKGVITIYQDGDKVQKFTGNENPNNARVLMINQQGKIVYFYDQGFAVDALNKLKDVVSKEDTYK
ncbi:hypothetical protein [Colwellia sp. RSH04]|uniref:hypothetical protein n=1 Tax=Colwellia sp. RSH04 TaxID=2305464 RepID=UPI000E58BA9A|nr:hypothetical protein [Colwellia sp. RSH04]RHW77890.1 hypothetical protein D1094_02905 [Colwellia sp. RSH04]